MSNECDKLVPEVQSVALAPPPARPSSPADFVGPVVSNAAVSASDGTVFYSYDHLRPGSVESFDHPASRPGLHVIALEKIDDDDDDAVGVINDGNANEDALHSVETKFNELQAEFDRLVPNYDKTEDKIACVMRETNCTREQAIDALRRCGNNLVDAILDLTP